MNAERVRTLSLVIVTAVCLYLAFLQMRWSVVILDTLLRPQKYSQPAVSVDDSSLRLASPNETLVAAGARAGDLVLAVNGQPVPSNIEFQRMVLRQPPGTTIHLLLQRADARPFEVSYTLQPIPAQSASHNLVDILAGIETPLLALALGAFVAFRRPTDPLALSLFVMLVALSRIAIAQGQYRPLLGNWFTIPNYLMTNASLPWLVSAWLWFAIQFPDPRSPHRLLPWMRWALAVPLGVAGLVVGIAAALILHKPSTFESLAPILRPLTGTWFNIASLTCVILGFANLIYKLYRERNPSARRRLRLVLAGFSVGMLPLATLLVVTALLGQPVNAFGEPVLIVSVLLLSVIPITLAYTVLVQRTLDVGVVVRQGMQYFFASGTVVIIRTVLIGALLWLAFRAGSETSWSAAQRIVAAGACLLTAFTVRWAGGKFRTWLDRHFFREQVDAERVLHELSDEVHRVMEPHQLLETVSMRIASALHISQVAALTVEGETLKPAFAHGYDDGLPEEIAGVAPLLAQLRTVKNPWRMNSGANSALGSLQPEVLLPLLSGESVVGVLTLGMKQSEEPYSRSDLRLLSAVARQTAMALENGRLAATLAAETARRERINSELAIARDVQQRLFPRTAPPVEGLELAGACKPAQTIGGDYFDYFLAPAGELVLAIGDVSGKGIPAALLMASLHSAVRSLSMAGIQSLAERMALLNRVIYDATPSNRFATLWCGVYDPGHSRLRFCSAGHNPALLRSHDGTVTPLRTKGVGLGLTRNSQYTEEEVQLDRGDLLVLFTDGVTETMNEQQAEFGEERLLESLDATLSAQGQLEQVVARCEEFAGGAPQHDDLTLIVGRRV